MQVKFCHLEGFMSECPLQLTYITALRYCLHMYALSLDITENYRQIIMHEEDRNSQLTMCIEHPSEQIQKFKLNIVTYTEHAPFLAIRCLLRLSDQNRIKYPLNSFDIKIKIYVDDLLTGSKNSEYPNLLRSAVINI